MHWQLAEKNSEEFHNRFPQRDDIILQLLYNRQLIDDHSIQRFLNPDFEHSLLDPFLFKDMAAAVERLFKALNAHERIIIYGDYDADGVCSTSILYQALEGLGAIVDLYIPFRENEGYGLNKKVTQQIIDQKFQLVITVDCGVANHEEIAMFKTAGVDTIVLDHHEEPLKLPDALALIDAHLAGSGYPYKDLCGAGVVFKFIQAVIKWQEDHNSQIKLPVGFEKWLLDEVAIATIGDIVELTEENRALVKYGLLVINKTKNLGLQRLLAAINNKNNAIDAEYVGWRIVPRLNAAGRINHASAAFYLLTAKTEAEADKWVKMLDENNRFRQQLTEKLMTEAEIQLGEFDSNQKAIIIVGEGWPTGVLGLVAGRLCDRYRRPTLVFSRDGDKYVASGRSIEEFDITAVLKICDKYLARYGGHPQACGLTVLGGENLGSFRTEFLRLAQEQLANLDLQPTLAIEAEVTLSQLTWPLVKELEKFEPFGEANPRPRFLASRLRIEQVQTVGADGKHLKVLVSQAGDLNNLHKLIGFSFGDWCARLKAGDEIDIVFELGVNEWNGNRELQLKIVDLKLSKK